MSQAVTEISTATSGPSMTACAVKLPAFEGPLDLLLHLCRANEVDITDIPIALISQQYLEYLDVMRMLDIDVAADYLLMAATLAHIKSRILLPPDAEADEAEGADPRAELARRLAEYAVFKEAALELAERPRLGRDVFEGRADLADVPVEQPELAVSMFSLVEAMQRVLARLPEAELHHEVAREQVRLRDRMVHVMDVLGAAPDQAMPFEDLLSDAARTRARVVATFLALLELAKIQAIALFQNLAASGHLEGPVWARLAVEGGPDAAAIERAAAQAEAELAERVTLSDERSDEPPREPQEET